MENARSDRQLAGEARTSVSARAAAPWLPPLLLLAAAANSAQPEAEARGYFVDCDGGNDSSSGTAPDQAWKTLRKVNSSVHAAGSDVFLKAGTTCGNQTLTVNWEGSSSDRVIIGSYRMSGSKAVQGFDGSSRPTIKGTYGSACRSTTPSTCPVGIDANLKDAVPANQWDGLINVRTSHVTVQDIALADSSGSGLAHIGDNTTSDLVVQNLSITQTLGSGILLQRVKSDVLRNNTVDRVALKKVDGRVNNWPPGIMVTDAAPSNTLIEGNTLTNSAGEGIGVLRSSHTIIRGNTVANNRRPLIYLDNASDNVVEHNLLLGNGYMNGADESYGIALSIAVEPYKRDMRNSVKNIVRNNLMANTRGCINLEVFRDSKHNCGPGGCDDPAAKGYKVGALIYGNTCLQEKGLYVNSANLTVKDNIDKIEIVDNVFSAKAGRNCALPEVPTSLLKIDSNAFGTRPSDDACVGTNAKIGAAGIPLDYSGVNSGSVPSPESFRPSASSAAHHAGDSADRKVIDIDAFPPSMREFSWSTCRPSAADWAKVLAYDYECKARGDRPSIGGLE